MHEGARMELVKKRKRASELYSSKLLARTFRWRTREGEMLAPADMRTKHLFYTFKMIWNHGMPEEYRIWDEHRYSFNSFYTKEYILTAFAVMYHELKRRDDLGPKMASVVAQIETILRTPQIENAKR